MSSDNIGSQEPEIMCHSTGIDVPPKNTAHLAMPRGGYFHIRRSGGLDLTSSLEAKFGARFSQVHQIRGKIWEVLLP